MVQSLEMLVLEGIRAGLAAVLVAAGSAKLADTSSFAATLTGLGLTKARLVRGLAVAIPAFEVSLGLAVAAGVWPGIIDAALVCLMAVFAVVVFAALQKAPQVACRCFGALSDTQFSVTGLIRSLALTAGAIVVAWGGNAASLTFTAPIGAIVLLVAGYLVFGVTVAQAAKTIAELKVSMM